MTGMVHHGTIFEEVVHHGAYVRMVCMWYYVVIGKPEGNRPSVPLNHKAMRKI